MTFTPELQAGARDKYGFPIKRLPSRKTEPFEDRFWRKVAKGLPDECWNWLGPVQGGGAVQHGCIYRNGRTASAHRVAYAMAYGAIPDGLVVRHKCDNPVCVNPFHLETGTIADNNRDSCVRERRPRRQLTNMQAYTVRKLHLFGLSDPEIAQVLGVTRDAVFKSRTLGFTYVGWPVVISKYEIPHIRNKTIVGNIAAINHIIGEQG